MWYQKILTLFKNRELRNKILFVLGIFVVFRLTANIPIPGIDLENLRKFFSTNQFFGLLNIFSGGALSNLSIAMLGLGPHITAVIILQLLTMIFPQLEKLYREEGEAGRQKFNQYGRILTVPLAALQGYAMLNLFQHQKIIGDLPLNLLFVSILTITAGSVFLMWLGELISEKGIGNGISLLIFAGIVAGLPVAIRQIIITWDPSKIPSYLIFVFLSFLITSGVVLINEARRNIPISYAKRVRGTRMYGGVSTYLPLSINPAGVMPIIFALSILLFPGMIANFFTGSSGILGTIAHQTGQIFQNPWFYSISYFILVGLFTYFYTLITFEPKTVAENLQKMGGFVPGVRPGKSTAEFLKYILNRVLFLGAIFLGLIAVLPSIVSGSINVQGPTFLIGGTSLLIMVSAVLETMRQINSQLQMREYETF
ncbi:MAG: preprotein translocase subunit SecY [Candidatus Staskawiczbacteria bacterium CG10_big_fil_rev_8_21_14_0_10_38_10]|uniref:Protein translocase subunit SecY n=1 Tax=Candidatus Staskawiczbacteria bacterium CG10_big_fil_rev_8_21_14_0_10_38_10 TaxID=1974891 RepID=A0A2H9T220_9BACT|nr:MAG: preprotein translocase subunit SecY [Candidatus Staskawiczbacteria bacterium CG10_big_fil_rev_8_21_14_0_10_38_10]